MAIVIVYEGTTQQASGTSLDSANWSPTSNHLIIATGWTFLGTAPTISDTFTDTGGGTWQTIYTFQQAGVNAWLSAFYRQLGSTPGTGHITLGTNGNDEAVLGAFDAGGHDTTTPIRQFTNLQTTLGSTSITLTLGSTPRSDSCVISCAFDILSGNTLTPTVGFSSATGLAGFDGDSQFSAFQNGSAPQSMSWTGLDNRTQDIGGYFEIQTPLTTPTVLSTIKSNVIAFPLAFNQRIYKALQPGTPPPAIPNIFYLQNKLPPFPLAFQPQIIPGRVPPVAPTVPTISFFIQNHLPLLPPSVQKQAQVILGLVPPTPPTVTNLPIWNSAMDSESSTFPGWPVNIIDTTSSP